MSLEHPHFFIHEAITAIGAILVYLPPYSPELDPIELVFSKLKWLVRSESPRMIERLWAFLGQALNHFLPDECLRYFLHCSYATSAWV